MSSCLLWVKPAAAAAQCQPSSCVSFLRRGSARTALAEGPDQPTLWLSGLQRWGALEVPLVYVEAIFPLQFLFNFYLKRKRKEIQLY